MGRLIIIEDIPIEVIRKKGKKTLSLKIDLKTGKPQVSIPYLCPLILAKNFVKKHIIWLKKHIETREIKKEFSNGMNICLLGQELTITHTSSYCITHIEGNNLLVGGHKEHLHRRIKDFIKKRTYDYIRKKADEITFNTGKQIAKITIRDTSSRWGSCSSNGNLSFCWRLALAPLFVIDYVIIHEVAHLKHMNHSIDFWQHVKEMGGQTRNAKKWLKENSSYLHSFL